MACIVSTYTYQQALFRLTVIMSALTVVFDVYVLFIYCYILDKTD